MHCIVARVLPVVLCAGLNMTVLHQRSPGAPPTHTVHIQLGEDNSAAARIRVVAVDGGEYEPDMSAVRTTKAGESYFYANGSCEVTLPEGPAQLFVSGGMESLPQVIPFDVLADVRLNVEMRTWIDMASRSWYSGDSHVHLHTGGPIGVTIDDALVAARAEGLNYVNLCVSNNTGDDIRDADLITGRPHSASTDRHLLVFGEEMRSSIYGHMQFFGITSLVEPQYTGFDDTPNHFDFPANYVMATEACRQGGVVTYGHPMFKGQPSPFGEDLTASHAAARELPIDAILNVAQAVDLMSYNSDEDLSAELWYRLLNCGLKLSACVGTDALLDRSTDPMGGSRVYVKTRGPFTMRSWLEGLAAGRTFVTNGPMPLLTVEGAEPGESITTEAGSINVKVTVESYVPIEHVDVMVNGRVAIQRDASPKSETTDTQRLQFAVDVPIERSSWIAVRVRGAEHPYVFDGPIWAHTSPVYVLVDGQPIRSDRDAEYFVEWIDQLLRVVAARNRYADVDDRNQVESLFKRAREEFRRRVLH